jgi:hypothetical protein
LPRLTKKCVRRFYITVPCEFMYMCEIKLYMKKLKKHQIELLGNVIIKHLAGNYSVFQVSASLFSYVM